MANHTYQDLFRVTAVMDDKYICSSYNDYGGCAECVIHQCFLDAHDVGLGEAFMCKVDTGGGILLETIRKMSQLQ